MAATTATWVNLRCPSDSALNRATRSAAHCQSIGGVLNIAAGDDLAVGRQEGGADLKIRERGHGEFACPAGSS